MLNMNKHFFITLFFLVTTLCQAQTRYSPIFVDAQRRIKEKPDIAWETFETHIVQGLKTFNPWCDYPVNRYGSSLFKKHEATGYFYTKKIDGRWWYIDPEGYAHIQKVVVGVRQGTSPRNLAAFAKKYRSSENWMNAIVPEMKELGFNGSGSWSDNDALIGYNARMSDHFTYTPILNMMSSYGNKRGGTYQLPGNTGYPNQAIFVFDPEFALFCDAFAKEQLAKYKHDRNVIGIFSDNELPFGLANLEGYLTLKDENDPGRKMAENWLRSKRLKKNEITDAVRAEFAGVVADKYYSIVSQAIRKYAPNHLYLGSRLHGGAKFVKEIILAAGKYCDVVSINYYGDWQPSKAALSNWNQWIDKPFIITEFYTKGMDSGLANTSGAGWKVATQKDRGYAYQHFCLSLLENKQCIGWHWFRYQDNDPETPGADPSNLDSNKGIVNNGYEYYTDLTKLMKELNINTYRLIDFFDAFK